MKFLSFIYKYSNYIVSYVFLLYLFIYIILKLYRRDIIFDYILILLLGLYLGYKFAAKSYDYYLDKNKE